MHHCDLALNKLDFLTLSDFENNFFPLRKFYLKFSVLAYTTSDFPWAFMNFKIGLIFSCEQRFCEQQLTKKVSV